MTRIRALVLIAIRRGLTSRGKLDIGARGIATQAVVQSLSVPGEIRDGYAKVVLGLAVTRPDGSTFSTHTEKFVSARWARGAERDRIARRRRTECCRGWGDRPASVGPVVHVSKPGHRVRMKPS